MPVSFLSPAQRQRYGRYDGNPSAEQLARYFHLDDADRAAVADKRGEHNRLGYALQLTTVRFLGTFLEDLATVPASVLQTLRRQLGLSGPDQLIDYAQGEQRWVHAEQIRAEHGYRTLNDRQAGFALARWLYAQCWTGTDRPSVLFDRATASVVYGSCRVSRQAVRGHHSTCRVRHGSHSLPPCSKCEAINCPLRVSEHRESASAIG